MMKYASDFLFGKPYTDVNRWLDDSQDLDQSAELSCISKMLCLQIKIEPCLDQNGFR